MKTTQPYSIFNTVGTGNDATVRAGVAASGTQYSNPWSAAAYGLHFESTGTVTATLTLWCSDKPAPDLTSDADWVQETSFSPTNPAGAATKFRDDVLNANARWKRLKCVTSGGAGTLFGYVTPA